MAENVPNSQRETPTGSGDCISSLTPSSSSLRTDSSGSSSGSDLRLSFQGDGQGYDLEFEPQIEKKYECPICLLVLREPVQTLCGHRFCRNCLSKWTQLQQDKTPAICPVCNTSLDSNQTFPDNCAKREILSLTVRCPHKDCGTLSELRELQKHLDVCDFAEQLCPNGCGEQLIRQDMVHHLDNECSHRKVLCQYCKKEIHLHELKEHSDFCPEMNTPCPFCNLHMPRMEHVGHIHSSCDQAPIACYFAPFGCNKQIVRRDLEDHLTSHVQSHLQLVADHIIKHQHTQPLYDIPDTTYRDPSHPPVPVQSSMESHASSASSGFFSKSTVKPIPSFHPGFPLGFYSQESNLGPYEPVGLPSGMPMSDPLSSRTQMKLATDRMIQSESKPSSSQDDIHGLLAGRDQTIAQMKQDLENSKKQIAGLSMKLSRAESTIRDLTNVVNDFEGRNCNGCYIWKITNYRQRRYDAINRKATVTHSPGFYSSFYGYKLCMRINFNGVESGEGSYISLFVHFMKGQFDDIVDWPFEGSITISIIDQNEVVHQRQHVVETLCSKPDLAAFQRPTSERNHKGFGYLEYAPIAQLEQNHFNKNDTLYIKAEIETKYNTRSSKPR